MNKKLVTLSNRQANVFVDSGFSNWKKGTKKFSIHEKSSAHKEATEKILYSKQTPISAILSEQVSSSQAIARTVLKVIFSSIKYLGQQGLALRGGEHHDGNLWQLVLERVQDVPSVKEWLNKRDTWMSDTIQKEIIQMFAHSVQRSIVTNISQCSYLGLTADGTTDVAGHEQFSVSIRYVGPNLKVQECFMGFYNCQNSTAETLFNAIIDVFTRCTIPMNKLVGYAFDGASNMSGHLSGERARLGETYPQAVYVHCANHSLDLVLQEVCFEVKMVIDTIQFVRDVGTIIRESSKRKALYESLFGSDDIVLNLVSLCPTRWCIRAKVINRVMTTYGEVYETLSQLAGDMSVRVDARAKISGLAKQVSKAQTFYGVLLCDALFSKFELVAKALQSPSLSASAAEKCV